MIELGEAVGVIAAQSIGEPGTQLTMRTFHTGGVVGEDITHGLPRVVELFEARTPKGAAVLAHHSGVVRVEDDETGRRITVVADDGTEDSTLVAARAHLEVTDGQEVGAGDALVEGPKDPKELLEVKGIRETQQYLVEEVQKVYRDQGVSIHDKHIELIVRQMLRRVLVAEPGDAPFLPGERVDNQIYAEVNRTLVEDGNVPAEGRPELMGITKASLATESWLSAASFQETTRVLTEAAIEGRSDQLFGLKENIIIGKLIPAGSGMEHYRNIRLEMPDAEAMPFWAMGSGESDTEDLANWLRDMGEGVSEDPFDSSIDASWLGAAPTAEDAFGNPIVDDRQADGSAARRGARRRAPRRPGPKLLSVRRGTTKGRDPVATPRMVADSDGPDGARAGRAGPLPPVRTSRALEAQSIHVFREVAAEFERPDAAVLGRQGLHRHAPPGHEGLLAGARALPGAPRRHGAQLQRGARVPGPPHGGRWASAWWWPRCRTTSTPAARSRTPSPGATRNRLQTPTLLRAIAEGRHDAVFGGARRDEEKARAKERIFSFRDEFGQWDPKNQRPELWNLYNARHNKGEHIRVFPLSNWTELDVWNYIRDEEIDVPPIYFAHRRQVFQRDGMLMAVTEHLAPDRGRPGLRGHGALPDRGRRRLHRVRRVDGRDHRPRHRRGGGHPDDRAGRHPGRRPDFGGRHGGSQAGGVLLMTELLRLATAGSVDDGKSTLIGRLLYDAKGIFEDQLEAIRRTSEQRGGIETDLALLTDGLRAEREQGITIDVAYRYFATPKRKFIIADTPGHTEYTRNMVTGASNAHVALILIDARKGVIEQTRRHAFLSSMLGVPHMVVCVNKMDLIDWDQARYERIKSDFMEFAARLNVHDITFIPISALRGDNVVQRSEHMWWYDGSPLLNHLESVYIGSDENFIDPRFPVQYVIRSQTPENPDFRGYAGTVASGVLRPGDDVLVMPTGHDIAHRLHRHGGRRGGRGVPAHGRRHHAGRRHRRVAGRHPLPAQQPPNGHPRH